MCDDGDGGGWTAAVLVVVLDFHFGRKSEQEHR